MSAETTLPFSQALAKLDSILQPNGSSSYDKFHNSSITPVISASLDLKRLLGLGFLGPKDLVCLRGSGHPRLAEPTRPV